MDNAEFDKFAEEYNDLHKKNITYFGDPIDFFAEYKIKDIFRILDAKGFNPARILDFGAGTGASVPYFRKFFPESQLTCLDVSEKSLQVASTRYPGLADFLLFDGDQIPESDSTFDLVFASCVFHHIPHPAHLGLLQELLRVLKPGGTAVIYEHNPLNPLTVRAVNTCAFDENAELIRGSTFKNCFRTAGFQVMELRYRLFAPGFLRALRPLENWLGWFPLGAQYYVHAIKPQ